MEERLFFLTLILVLGIAAQWLAWRLHLPSILVLLAAGFFAGYLGGFDPDHLIGTDLLFPVVSLAVSVILLEGGLTLQFHELKHAGRVVFRLVSVGVLVAWALTGLAGYWLLGMHWKVAVLTGAILVVTGPTVVGPLLRFIRPSKRMGSIIKWEGIVIDPVGAILAVLTFEVLLVGESRLSLVLLKSLGVGFGFGLFSACLLLQLLKRYLIPDFLHSAAILAAAIGAFALSDYLAPEAGLITVTVLGVALANQKQVPVSHILEFKENLRVLLISSLFIVLSARIEPTAILSLGFQGVGFLALLILVVRPLSVMAATIGTGLNLSEKTFLSFLAPRGIVAAAVSSVFAFEAQQRLPNADAYRGLDQVAPITFLVIVGTVAIYGLGSAPLARKLGLSVPNPQGILFAGAASWIRQLAKLLVEEGFPVVLVDTNYRNVAEARMMGLTAECGSIVSEYVSEEMDLAGVGRLLAMTPNDDLNSLAAMEYANLFGRAEVYQVAPWAKGVGHRDVSQHIRGRLLFHDAATYNDLALRISTGAEIKKTKITSEFTYDDFRARYGENALLLFAIGENRQLTICTAADVEAFIPQAGQKIIALVEPAKEQAIESPTSAC